MKKFMWIIGILVLIVIIFIVVSNLNKYYVKNYFAVIGLPGSHLYSDVKSVYGEPKNIIPGGDDSYVTVQYDGIDFMLMAIRDNPIDGDLACSALVSSPEFRFGKDKIGVGSTREEIEKTYMKFKRIKEADCGFIDGLTWIEFCFDENDQVNKIAITPNGP